MPNYTNIASAPDAAGGKGEMGRRMGAVGKACVGSVIFFNLFIFNWSLNCFMEPVFGFSFTEGSGSRGWEALLWHSVLLFLMWGCPPPTRVRRGKAGFGLLPAALTPTRGVRAAWINENQNTAKP